MIASTGIAINCEAAIPMTPLQTLQVVSLQDDQDFVWYDMEVSYLMAHPQYLPSQYIPHIFRIEIYGDLLISNLKHTHTHIVSYSGNIKSHG